MDPPGSDHYGPPTTHDKPKTYTSKAPQHKYTMYKKHAQLLTQTPIQIQKHDFSTKAHNRTPVDSTYKTSYLHATIAWPALKPPICTQSSTWSDYVDKLSE